MRRAPDAPIFSLDTPPDEDEQRGEPLEDTNEQPEITETTVVGKEASTKELQIRVNLPPKLASLSL